MSNSFFHFRNFTIRQEKCAMKVGTDGVLLGAWVDVNLPDVNTVLDVGAGSGLIALMIAQRNNQAKIDAIEIDADACEQAIENVENSPFGGRIRVIRQSFFDYIPEPEKKYDLILSNPPFFKNALPCKDKKRNTARHDDCLPLKELIEHALSLLSTKGRIALVLPVSASDEFNFIVATHQLFIRRRTDVVTVEGGVPKRFLVEISNFNHPIQESSTLVLETNEHKRTEQYAVLTKDFFTTKGTKDYTKGTINFVFFVLNFVFFVLKIIRQRN